MNPIIFEEVKIELPELRTFYKKVERHLTFSELRILIILLSEPARIVPTSELIHRANLTSRESLAKYINSLRDIMDKKYIFTHRNLGYSFSKESS